MIKLPKRIVRAIAAVSALGAVLLAYSYFIEPTRLVATTDTLYIKNWNAAFDGLKIVLIGDIHGGSNGATEEKLRQVVTLTNQQNADIVVLLGDYVSQKVENRPVSQRTLRMPMETIADNLSGIRATYGVFAVLGNHDGWYGDDRAAAELTRIGYRVLQNEVAVIERNGQRLRIFGMRDHLHLPGGWVQTSNDARALMESTGSGDIILLEHSPDILQVVSGAFSISPDLRLMLSAHTHGGQVWMPVLGRAIVPSGYGQKYAYGHVVDNNVDLWVTSGVGTSVLPFRFMVPPEIAVLTIHPAN